MKEFVVIVLDLGAVCLKLSDLCDDTHLIPLICIVLSLCLHLINRDLYLKLGLAGLIDPSLSCFGHRGALHTIRKRL
jgi:hypothetical protein